LRNIIICTSKGIPTKIINTNIPDGITTRAGQYVLITLAL